MAHNLADPAYEPSDEELRELSRAAFEHLPEARRQSDLKLKQDIARLSAEVLSRLHAVPTKAK